MASTPRFCVGIDENGLGPRLGPLIVTGVMARVHAAALPVVHRKPRGALARRLGDSKGLVAHGDVALGEAWARVLAERLSGRAASTPQELVEAFALEDRAALRAPCPRHVEAQCWGIHHEALSDDDEQRARMKTVTADLRRLERRGVQIVAVHASIVCTRRLNEQVDQGQSRFVVDLHAMERLVLRMRELAAEEIDAVCGKVGGYGQYSRVFGPLGGRLHAVLEEGRLRSAYRFPGIGQVAFVQDSDAHNLLVGMSSLVGKYLRELLMGRIVAHYRRDDPELPVVSGYHDPMTSRFVLGTSALRRRQKVPDACFERGRLAPAALGTRRG